MLIPAGTYMTAQRVRRLLCDEFDEALSRVDVLVTPTSPMAAPTIEEMQARVRHCRRQEDQPARHGSKLSLFGHGAFQRDGASRAERMLRIYRQRTAHWFADYRESLWRRDCASGCQRL